MHSRSISGESKDMENEQETFAGIPLLVVPSTPVKVRGCVMHIKKHVLSLRGCVVSL